MMSVAKVTDEDDLLSRSMVIKANNIIMNERIIAVREEPNSTLNSTRCHKCEPQYVVEHGVVVVCVRANGATCLTNWSGAKCGKCTD